MFDKNGCSIYDKGNILLVHCKEKDGLYKIQSNPRHRRLSQLNGPSTCNRAVNKIKFTKNSNSRAISTERKGMAKFISVRETEHKNFRNRISESKNDKIGDQRVSESSIVINDSTTTDLQGDVFNTVNETFIKFSFGSSLENKAINLEPLTIREAISHCKNSNGFYST